MYAALFPLRHMKDGKISSYLMKNDYMNTLKPAIPALNARKNVDTGKSGNYFIIIATILAYQTLLFEQVICNYYVQYALKIIVYCIL